MAHYCPNCGTATIKRTVGGRERDACANCSFVQYASATIGVGALVFRRGKVLMVKRYDRALNVFFWALPGGFVEQDERLHMAVKREVFEETGLDVMPRGLLVVRNMEERGNNDLFSVFLCDDLGADQQLRSDYEETYGVRFIHPYDFKRHHIEYFTSWVVKNYRQHNLLPIPLVEIAKYAGQEEDKVIYANYTQRRSL